MEKNNQPIENIQPQLDKEVPKSQKKLVCILLILVMVLFGIVIYFLIKDEIIELPFLKTEQNNSEEINEETDEVKEFNNEEESQDQNDNSENQSNDSNEEEETEEISTTDWLTYQLENPQLSFKYPEGITVREYPKEDSNYIHLAISGAKESLNFYIFQAVGGPGSGTADEIEEPELTKVIGEFFDQDIIEIKNGDFYKFVSYLTECEDCGDTSLYMPECICEDTDNYVMNGIFTTDLDWEEDNGGDTYIAIELKWTLSEYDREIYEDILLSFQKD